MSKPILFLATLLFVSSPAIAQVPDVPNLCKVRENTIWSCRAARKIFSLCASRDLGPNSGYLQYRAGTHRHTSFVFPNNLVHPRSKFDYHLSAHGAGVSFQNGAFAYDIGEDLKELANIWVHGPGVDKTIQCQDATQSLNSNATMGLFKAAGIRSDDP